MLINHVNIMEICYKIKSIFGKYIILIRCIFVYILLVIYTQCNNMIDMYGPTALQMMLSIVEPNSICKVNINTYMHACVCVCEYV